MIVIRDAQMAALGAAHAERHDRWLATHARRCFPRQCQALGEGGLVALIAQARAGAREVGLSSPRGIACWLDLMMGFGPGFADDPAHPWVRPTLRESAALPEPLRIDGLFLAAQTWARRTPFSPDGAQG
jgi:hypothetical protein